MSFPKYEEYKDSGVEWLGEVPDEWAVYRSKVLFAERNVKASEEDEQLTASQKYGVIPQKCFSELEDQKVMQVIVGRSILKRAEANDFVISMRSFQGGLEFCPYSGAISSAYVPLYAKRDIDNSYFKYLFKTDSFIVALQQTSNLVRDGQALRYANFTQLSLPLPSIDEQRKIGQLLDHETSRIDALIAEQERLIALLKEKRQAVISHAVTKGLDSTVKMKDSGVEWLGEVPEHWKIHLLRRAFNSIDYGISDSLKSEGNIAVLRMGNIQNGAVIKEDLKYSDCVPNELFLEEDDLLYNRTNSLDQIGKVGLFHEDNDLKFSFASYLVRLRVNALSNPKYFAYLLNTREILDLARSNAFISIGQCNLNPSRYGYIVIAVPSYEEQVEIVKYLEEQISTIDSLIAQADEGTRLLKERRSALISAAVTGKIDVRNWRPPADIPSNTEEAIT